MKARMIADFSETIGVYPGAIAPNVCKSIVSTMEECKDEWRRGSTLGGEQLDSKNTWDISCDEDPRLHRFEEIFTESANTHIEKYLDNWPFQDSYNPYQLLGGGTHYPCWQLQKYEKQEGHYNAWHTEEPHLKTNSHRLFVVMWYLNDVTECGHTKFLYNQMQVEPREGTFVCWPAGWPWVHSGSMPISNDKYICTTWLQADWGPIFDSEGRDTN